MSRKPDQTCADALPQKDLWDAMLQPSANAGGDQSADTGGIREFDDHSHRLEPALLAASDVVCDASPVQPQISVMVCVRDDWRVLRLLESLRAQTLDPSRFEVVVVNNGREDYGSRLEGFPFDVTVVRTGGGSLAAARSRGFELVRGTYFATTDADCVTTPQWLDALLYSFEHEDATLVGVGGAIRKYATGTLVQRHGITANDGQKGLQYLPASPLPYVTGANAAYRTEAVRRVGGALVETGQMHVLPRRRSVPGFKETGASRGSALLRRSRPTGDR